jgi:hypothetical protein
MRCHAITSLNAICLPARALPRCLIDKLEILVTKGLTSSSLLVDLPVMPDEDEQSEEEEGEAESGHGGTSPECNRIFWSLLSNEDVR